MSIAVPIRLHDGSVFAAVTIAAPGYRMPATEADAVRSPNARGDRPVHAAAGRRATGVPMSIGIANTSTCERSSPA